VEFVGGEEFYLAKAGFFIAADGARIIGMGVGEDFAGVFGVEDVAQEE
jgi:hypothetical protein